MGPWDVLRCEKERGRENKKSFFSGPVGAVRPWARGAAGPYFTEIIDVIEIIEIIEIKRRLKRENGKRTKTTHAGGTSSVGGGIFLLAPLFTFGCWRAWHMPQALFVQAVSISRLGKVHLALRPGAAHGVLHPLENSLRGQAENGSWHTAHQVRGEVKY